MVLMKSLPEGRVFDIIRLLVVVPLAAGAYLLAAKLLRIKMLSIFTGRGRTRR
jgi:hypothetical protein